MTCLFAPLFLANALPFVVFGERRALALWRAGERDSMGGKDRFGGSFDAAFGRIRGEFLLVPVRAHVAIGCNVV